MIKEKSVGKEFSRLLKEANIDFNEPSEKAWEEHDEQCKYSSVKGNLARHTFITGFKAGTKSVNCNTCGFPKDMKRKPVFIKNNAETLISLAKYDVGKCKECGHQSNGWTIESVYNHICKILPEVKRKERLRVIIEVREFCAALRKSGDIYRYPVEQVVFKIEEVLDSLVDVNK